MIRAALSLPPPPHPSTCQPDDAQKSQNQQAKVKVRSSRLDKNDSFEFGKRPKFCAIMAGVGCGLYAGLLPPLGPMVRSWIMEDVPSFDYGGAVVGDKGETMTLFCKAPVSRLTLQHTNQAPTVYTFRRGPQSHMAVSLSPSHHVLTRMHTTPLRVPSGCSRRVPVLHGGV